MTALRDPSANLGINCSTVLSVMVISSAERISFAKGMVFNGRFAISGKGGSRAAIVASRCFCRSCATSCHVAPDAMVTVAAIVSRMVVKEMMWKTARRWEKQCHSELYTGRSSSDDAVIKWDMGRQSVVWCSLEWECLSLSCK